MRYVFSPDGHLVLWDSNSIRFYDVDTGMLLHTLTGRLIQDIAFSPDGHTLASTDNTFVRLWDTENGKRLHSFVGHKHQIDNGPAYAFPVSNVAFSHDGQTLATAGLGGTIHIFDVNTLDKLHTIIGYEMAGWQGNTSDSVAFSPDGQTLATTSPLIIHLWDTGTGELLRMLIGHEDTINCVAFSPDGQTLASGGYDNTIRLWNVDTGKKFRVFNNLNTENVYSLAFSPNGQIIASTCSSIRDSSVIELWDVDTGTLLRTLTQHTATIESVVFSPDGKTLASGSQDYSLRLWDVDTGTLLHTLHTENSEPWELGPGDKVYSVAFSPNTDRQIIASLDDSGIHLWDVDTGTLLRTIFKPPGTGTFGLGSDRSLAFSLDGQIIASPGNKIRLWDVDTGTLLRQIDGGATIVAFSPDGQSLTDGTFLWNIAAIPPIPEYLPEDVNQNGVVNIQDLVQISRDFGESCFNNGVGSENDVNEDGVVNILDLLLVAAAIGDTASAPTVWNREQTVTTTKAEIETWLREARRMNLTDTTFQRGIVVLEQLLIVLMPKESALLPNYPNPFNPETWIPYQLAMPADVSISIYAVDGKLVRTLDLGHQPIGIYESRSRAAYWNGKNEQGEVVVNGVYFYTLTTGDFSATRKMVISK